MKRLFSFVLTVSASISAFAAVPVVSNVVFSQNPTNLGVTVSYSLSGAPAIVTVDFTTNGVSIGAANIRAVVGAVNTYVETGDDKKILWACDLDWAGRFRNDGSLKAEVKAWPLDNPPDYMVCDLDTTNAVSFYPSVDALPHPVTNDLYRTSQLVMRRMHAANVTWCMGSPSASLEKGCTATENTTVSVPHLVTLSRDYYIGVFPVTQRQYYFMTGGYNGGRALSKCYFPNNDANPVEQVSYFEIRGTTAADGSGYDWPQDGHAVAPGSALGKLRALTGITSFDLPTEAQWEYACRAGTCTGLNSGKDVKTDGGQACANLAEVGWYGDSYGNASSKTHPVGLLKPNRWGLYDMHGNVWEVCLDRYSGDSKYTDANTSYTGTFASGWQSGEPTVDPIGPLAGQCIVCRGGNWFRAPLYARSAYRFTQDSFVRDCQSKQFGFRLVCNANFK